MSVPMRIADLAVSPVTRVRLHELVERRSAPRVIDISGPPGVGKKTAARALAAALTCDRPVGGEACGGCESCRRFVRATPPPIVEVWAAQDRGRSATAGWLGRLRLHPARCVLVHDHPALRPNDRFLLQRAVVEEALTVIATRQTVKDVPHHPPLDRVPTESVSLPPLASIDLLPAAARIATQLGLDPSTVDLAGAVAGSGGLVGHVFDALVQVRKAQQQSTGTGRLRAGESTVRTDITDELVFAPALAAEVVGVTERTLAGWRSSGALGPMRDESPHGYRRAEILRACILAATPNRVQSNYLAAVRNWDRFDDRFVAVQRGGELAPVKQSVLAVVDLAAADRLLDDLHRERPDDVVRDAARGLPTIDDP